MHRACDGRRRSEASASRPETAAGAGPSDGPVRGQDDTHPVERVGRVGRDDAVERDLGADEEDEERDARPEHLLVEGHLQKGREVMPISDEGSWRSWRGRRARVACRLPAGSDGERGRTLRSGAVTSGWRATGRARRETVSIEKLTRSQDSRQRRVHAQGTPGTAGRG